MIIEPIVAAMEEIVRMAHARELLWILNAGNASVVLNEDEYVRSFARRTGPKPLGLKFEASGKTMVVIFNLVNLI